jgi:hypothetical protein
MFALYGLGAFQTVHGLFEPMDKTPGTAVATGAGAFAAGLIAFGSEGLKLSARIGRSAAVGAVVGGAKLMFFSATQRRA